MFKITTSTLEFIARNWKTSLLGLAIIAGFVFWISKCITTDDFLKVLAFAASIGFFAQSDPKG